MTKKKKDRRLCPSATRRGVRRSTQQTKEDNKASPRRCWLPVVLVLVIVLALAGSTDWSAFIASSFSSPATLSSVPPPLLQVEALSAEAVTYPSRLNCTANYIMIPFHIPPAVLVDTSQRRIPLHIYQTWLTRNVTRNVCLNVKTTLDFNPEFEYTLFNDTDIEVFIKTRHLDDWKYYSRLAVGAFRCDYMRYLVLSRYGGLWLDFDARFVKPLRSTIQPSDEFVTSSSRSTVCQWAIISAPFHPVMIAIYEVVRSNIKAHIATSQGITGPTAYEYAYNLAVRNYTKNGTLGFSMVKFDDWNYNGTFVMKDYKIGLTLAEAKPHWSQGKDPWTHDNDTSLWSLGDRPNLPAFLGVHSMEQIALHNSWADCWVVVGPNIYDITSFLPGSDCDPFSDSKETAHRPNVKHNTTSNADCNHVCSYWPLWTGFLCSAWTRFDNGSCFVTNAEHPHFASNVYSNDTHAKLNISSSAGLVCKKKHPGGRAWLSHFLTSFGGKNITSVFSKFHRSRGPQNQFFSIWNENTGYHYHVGYVDGTPEARKLNNHMSVY